MIPTDLPQSAGAPSFDLERGAVDTVLVLLETGWLAVLAGRQVTRRSHEPEIAALLRSEMERERARRGIQMRILDEVRTRSSPSDIRPIGRIDIQVIYSLEDEGYFEVECKRVSGTKSNGLARKYVEEGVLRFVRGKYSPGHRWGAMVGFVVDGDAQRAVALVSAAIAARRKRVCLCGAWTEEKRFGTHDHLYSTRHRQRRSQSRIEILHLFLSLN